MRNIYRLRSYIEPAALLWSKTRNFDDLHDAVEKSRQARDRGSVEEMRTANQLFHTRVVALADSPALNSLMEQVVAEMRLFFHTMDFNPDFHHSYSEENARMVSLLEDCDQDAAAKLMRSYLADAEQALLLSMADSQLYAQGGWSAS
ncbi:GntR family transcriptional regulator [Glutamicibacter ardleyensis]|uniref:GntR family transcriptional regulator n=1 Tax=Glutamicibacter ardleyensis TaxID=225894 RepID=UPI003FD12244